MKSQRFSPARAILPAQLFRRPRRRLLIVGCGDVAQRALPQLLQRYRVYALVRRPEQAAALRALGVTPIRGDLDVRSSLARLGGLAQHVLHSAPPATQGLGDVRSRRLLAALSPQVSRLCYISTSGVYGDCAGDWVAETRPVQPRSPRGQRRVAAEALMRGATRRGLRVSILRAPGIYAAERLSLDRLRRGDPVLCEDEDVFTNHIHADDLAAAVLAALRHGRAGRAYNVCDASPMRMGQYYAHMAQIFDLPAPPAMTREQCAQRLSAMSLSFMMESRRLDNTRMRRELGLRLQYPNLLDGLRAARAEFGDTY